VIFALGATLPLLGPVVLLVGDTGRTHGYLDDLRRVDGRLRPVAAIVLILAGLHDPVAYWFL